MALTIILNPITLMLLTSSFIAILIALITIIFKAVAKKEGSMSEDAIVMYIGGEHESILTLKFPSSDALYWAVLKRVFRNVYNYLINSLHTGNVLDWLRYMSMWYGFLMTLAIMVSILVVLYGW
jgi:hypothetical protein|uniref:Sodium:proton antiporter n=1 Tax=Ignisphaera aggregans TaxID=334771 RepID=A0A7J2U4M1_9CREN